MNGGEAVPTFANHEDMLAGGTGTLAGMMLCGHAVAAGEPADWARQIDEKYDGDLLCGYLK